jgi:ABC-2 type transport system ATP-binding protein
MPALVILDEPTVGLDPIQIREIRTLIRELGRDHGVILSTHILPEVQATCDRVQIIHKGELVLNDRIEHLASHMKSARLTVAFRALPALDELTRLPGVHQVDALDNGRVRVLHDPQQDPSEAIVRLASDRQWGLYEIAPERVSLEQLFVELVTAEPGEAAA